MSDVLTREQQIRRIVETLRPTDPGSWDINITYVTIEFDAHDAQQRAEMKRLIQERDALKNALSDAGWSATAYYDAQLAQTRDRVTRLEEAIIEANTHNSVCVWQNGKYPHTCLYAPACELAYNLINEQARGEEQQP